jgi:hypothetical protein
MAVRRITIKLVSRDVRDSPEILTNVARAFPEIEELEIDMTALVFTDSSLGAKVTDCANDALEQQEQGIQQGQISIEPPTEVNKNNEKWYQMLLKEGVKATVQAVIKEIAKVLIEGGLND